MSDFQPPDPLSTDEAAELRKVLPTTLEEAYAEGRADERAEWMNRRTQHEPAAPDLAAIRLEAHEHGVKCMAESLRKILDGGPCEASVPPELAEVAKRLAAPSVAPEPLTDADFSRIARMAALLTREKYDYLPKTLDECRSFIPHQWVIDAMKNAMKEAAHQPRAPLPETLHTFLNAAAGEGLVLDGVDAADLYIALFPERYAAAVNSIDSGAAK